ncbi:MAG TPA: biopolymer transporter ExbD [Burkholderiaceae bacterium]|nr:biopolymer transporter ExbD [Burkholderiaceae bacterium]
MGMTPTSSSQDDDMMIDINTTPLIDVMLVLIIMLIITIPIQLHSVDINMPSNAPPPVQEPDVVTIDVDANNAIRWNGMLVPNRDALEERFTQIARQGTPPEVHLQPDKLAHYKTVAMVLATAQRLGVNKLGLVGHERFAR